MSTRNRTLALVAVTALTASAGPAAVARGTDPPVPHRPPAGHFSTHVDNPWMPMRPGTRWVFVGRTDEGTEHTVVTVLRRTKVVDGVRTVVVHDVTRRHGRLLEDTYDWYAQDRRGRVWYFGENTVSYEKGRPSRVGSWRAGRHGAHAGIVMLAHPRVGDRYRQEYRKGVAEDQARVVSMHGRADVPFGHFRGLLKTRDFTRLEPGADEYKMYTKGVGVVLEQALHVNERTALVRMTWR
ncbi:MAG: hypothetical protein HOQ22_00405 [Nocardioidaceae bacterium]|nr:hypothetical protein [Nocardioidaceae bacterium]NUS49489.1 hypothetical protein [Nocardioidaceae bacterium]